MRYFSVFVLIIFSTLVNVGLSTRCYVCSGLLTENCKEGVHSSDQWIQIQECDGKCIKLAVPADLTFNKDTTTKLCVPYSGLTPPGQAKITLRDCETQEYCHICDTDLCNSAPKISGIHASIAIALFSVLFLL